jgi:apolipoprotein N-acyltransferase
MLAIISGLALLYYGTLILDRFLSRKLDGILATLVFPLTWTSIEYLRSFLSSSGSHGSLVYSQFRNLPLMQLASVTGIWGLTFLICWLAPVLNLAWGKRFDWPKIRLSVSLFVVVSSLVLLFGGGAGYHIDLLPTVSRTLKLWFKYVIAKALVSKVFQKIPILFLENDIINLHKNLRTCLQMRRFLRRCFCGRGPFKQYRKSIFG